MWCNGSSPCHCLHAHSLTQYMIAMAMVLILGSLPDSLSLLSALKRIYINDNSLTGERVKCTILCTHSVCYVFCA